MNGHGALEWVCHAGIDPWTDVYDALVRGRIGAELAVAWLVEWAESGAEASCVCRLSEADSVWCQAASAAAYSLANMLHILVF